MPTAKLEYFDLTAAQLILEAVGAHSIKVKHADWRKLEFTLKDGTTHNIELGPADGVPVPLIETFVVRSCDYAQTIN